MKTIKIIDLLNKIAKGERFENCKMKFKEIEPEVVSEYVIYDRLYEEDLTLNDEVEIIEEEKEEKKEFYKFLIDNDKIYNVLNEIYKFRDKEKNIEEEGKIESIKQAINYYVNYEDNRLNEDIRCICNNLIISIDKINELIEVVNELKRGN